MSRPTNPGVPAGGPPPHRQPGQGQQAQPPSWPPPPPQGGAAWPPPQQPPQQQPPQAYAPPPAFAPAPPQQQPADPYGASGYHYPQGQPHADPYAQPPRPPGYAPRFEPFNGAPQQAQHQPPPRAPAPQRPPEPSPDYHQSAYHVPEDSPYAPPRVEQPRTAPPRLQPQQAPQPMPRQPDPQLRGTIADQWPTAAPARPVAPQPQADTRGYDLSAYEPKGGFGALGDPTPVSQRPSAGRAGEWPGQPPLQAPGQQPDRRFAPPPAESQIDLGGFNGQPVGQPAGRAVVAEQDFAHEDVEYEDDPPKRSRGLLIVGALVGAIALGGGLAYGYKMFLGPPGPGKTPPILKADKSPSKTQPADPGGKQFSGQAMKVMNGRLTDGSDAAASSGTSEDGVRKVTTLAISPSGGPQQAPAAGGPPGSVAMPGVYVVDPLRRGPPQPSPQQQQLVAQAPPPPIQQPQVAMQPPVQSPRTITLPPPRAEAPPPPAAPVTPVAKAPAAKAPARVASAAPAAVSDASEPAPKRPAPRPAPSGVGAATGGAGGYVAVLTSQRSSTDALAKFADLQQKYAVLQGRTPSVQEANLGEKGTYYRLVVSAGAKEQASALCSELKASGYTDCWVNRQ